MSGDSKVCTKCGVTKPLTGFYNQKGATDGKTSWCAECIRAKQRAYASTPEGKAAKKRHEQSDAGRAGQKRRIKRWNATENGKRKNKEKVDRYRATERGREVSRRVARDQYAKNPNRTRATAKVNYEIRCGRLPAPSTTTCKYCPAQAQQYHHYLGYDPEHWLDVEPVCRKCHTAIHHTPSNRS